MAQVWIWLNIYDEQDMVRSKKAFRTAEEAMEAAAEDVYLSLQDVDKPEWTLETAEWMEYPNAADGLRTTYVEDAEIEIMVYAVELE